MRPPFSRVHVSYVQQGPPIERQVVCLLDHNDWEIAESSQHAIEVGVSVAERYYYGGDVG